MLVTGFVLRRQIDWINAKVKDAPRHLAARKRNGCG